jgi:hypothetical protein
MKFNDCVLIGDRHFVTNIHFPFFILTKILRFVRRYLYLFCTESTVIILNPGISTELCNEQYMTPVMNSARHDRSKYLHTT